MNKYIGLIIVILLGCIPLFPLLHFGLPVTHDGQDHVARIANFYMSLSEGNVIPRWAGNLNWGYGHPILMFLYPLPSYFSSLFHFFGFSFIDSLKIVFGLSFILSGIGMYFWIRNIFGEKAGVLAAVLYMYAPYRFVDLYVRGAIGEHVAFAFIPFVFYFMFKESKKQSLFYALCISLSLSCLLLSHNAIAVMFLPLIAIYGVYLIIISKNKRLLTASYILSGFLGIGLSAFFLFPAYFEGKYTLRDIVTGKNQYRANFVESVFDFFVLSWSFGGSKFLSKQIGLTQAVGVMLGIFFAVKYHLSKQRFLCLVFLIAFFSSLFLMLPVSDIIWQKITLIQKFQFPWRFLSVTVWAAAILPVYPLLYIKKKKLAAWYVVCLSSIAVILCFPYYYQTNGYISRPDSFYRAVYSGTTDTGESSPIWSVRFMEHAAPHDAEVIDKKAVIKKLSRTSTKRTYNILVQNETARVRDNTLYFPGWHVFINGIETPIEFQDKSNRGLITYYVPKGNNSVTVEFTDTKLRMISNYLSILSLIIFLAILSFTSIIYLKKRS